MAATDLLQPRVETTPVIYAYSDTRFAGALKVGFTTRDVQTRMHEHYPNRGARTIMESGVGACP